MTTSTPPIKIKSGKKHVLDPGDYIMITKQFDGFNQYKMHFLIEQPNAQEELKTTGHLNPRFSKEDDLKKWCLQVIDSSKFFNPINEISLYGHASADGDFNFNLELSERRAISIEKWIKERFPYSNIEYTILFDGEIKSRDTNNENLRQYYRRVDLDARYYSLIVHLWGDKPKKDDTPSLYLAVGDRRHFEIKLVKDDPSKITVIPGYPSLDYSKIPGMLLEFFVHMLKVFKTTWPLNFEKETQFLLEYFEDKLQKRMSTPL